MGSGLQSFDMQGTSRHDLLRIFDNAATPLVEGGAVLMGNVRVLFTNSFAPTAGDFFDVITGCMIIDSLASYDMPTLAYGLQWQRSVVAMAGGGEALRFAVAAVPVPETYALLLARLGIVAWGSRRNRRRAAS